jgi:hypothetical protein
MWRWKARAHGAQGPDLRRRASDRGERPAFADSLERCLIDERGGWGDVPFVAFEHLRNLDHEVAPEHVLTDLSRSGDDAVRWDVAHSWQRRTDARQTSDSRCTGCLSCSVRENMVFGARHGFMPVASVESAPQPGVLRHSGQNLVVVGPCETNA